METVIFLERIDIVSLFLNLQVHGNQRSIMQNLLNHPSLLCTATNVNNYWCLLNPWLYVTKKCRDWSLKT